MISNAIIMIAAIIIVTMLIGALFPQIFGIAGSVTKSSGDANDRLGTSATVVNYDLQAPGMLEFDVLNNGRVSLSPYAINLTAVYLDNDTSSANLLAQGAAQPAECWDYTIAGDAGNAWAPGAVLQVRAYSPACPFAPGDYVLKMMLYDGATVQYSFTI